MLTEKELKRQLREIKKIKKACRVGSKERKELNKQSKEIKQQLEKLQVLDGDKEPIISEIILLDKDLSALVDLRKYSVQQLEFHLKKLKEKARNKI